MQFWGKEEVGFGEIGVKSLCMKLSFRGFVLGRLNVRARNKIERVGIQNAKQGLSLKV